MDYVFGTEGEIEVLKTKGGTHSDLTGYQQIVQEFPGEKITDNFRVVKKTGSAEDGEGNCYDWYEIDRHYRTVDKSAALQAELEAARQKLAASIQSNAMLEECLVEMAGVVYG